MLCTVYIHIWCCTQFDLQAAVLHWQWCWLWWLYVKPSTDWIIQFKRVREKEPRSTVSWKDKLKGVFIISFQTENKKIPWQCAKQIKLMLHAERFLLQWKHRFAKTLQLVCVYRVSCRWLICPLSSLNKNYVISNLQLIQLPKHGTALLTSYVIKPYRVV